MSMTGETTVLTEVAASGLFSFLFGLRERGSKI